MNDKQNAVHTYKGVSLSLEKKGNSDTYNAEEP